MAWAEASLSTSMLSMSLGLSMAITELPVWPSEPPRPAKPWLDEVLPPTKGTPSMTNRGSLELMEVTPRTFTDTPPPGCPPLEVTVTPAALPCRSWSTPATGMSFSSVALSVVIDEVTSDRLAVP